MVKVLAKSAKSNLPENNTFVVFESLIIYMSCAVDLLIWFEMLTSVSKQLSELFHLVTETVLRKLGAFFKTNFSLRPSIACSTYIHFSK